MMSDDLAQTLRAMRNECALSEARARLAREHGVAYVMGRCAARLSNCLEQGSADGDTPDVIEIEARWLLNGFRAWAKQVIK